MRQKGVNLVLWLLLVVIEFILYTGSYNTNPEISWTNANHECTSVSNETDNGCCKYTIKHSEVKKGHFTVDRNFVYMKKINRTEQWFFNIIIYIE